MGSSSAGRVKRGETKYPYIGAFSDKIGMSRYGAYKALERGDIALCAEYEGFIKEQAIGEAKARIEAKKRVSNAVELSRQKITQMFSKNEIW